MNEYNVICFAIVILFIYLFSKYECRQGSFTLYVELSLLCTAVSEQRASSGSQAGSEGTEGESDTGGPPGALLQRLAPLLHHQHGSGQ